MFELVWRRRHVEILAYKRADTPLTLDTVGTRGAALQVSLDIQTLFNF
jgi:hypothetical protein